MPPERRYQLSVMALALLGALLVALYVVWVSHMTVHHQINDTVEQAAITAAQKLAQVTVKDQVFGTVGLCDLPVSASGGETSRQRTLGLNTIYATLRLTAIIAAKLDNPVMFSLCTNDLLQARQLQQDLTQALYQSVEPEPYRSYLAEGIGPVYREVYKAVSAEAAREKRRLLSVRIALGTLEGEDAPCTTPAPRSPGDASSQQFSSKGFYLPLHAVPVPGSASVRFYPLADKAMLVDPARFKSGQLPVAPSAVMIEVSYALPVDSENILPATRVEKACAIVGAPAVHREASAFMIDCPQGSPPQFTCVSDILSGRHWLRAGQWQQAAGAAVPGDGTLEPLPEDSLPDMLPGDALATALYHWLRYVGTEFDPGNVTAMLEQRWSTPPPASGDAPVRHGGAADQPAAINSCLVRETGARRYAIANQTGPGGAGQSAISKAFSTTLSNQARPASALPLIVDAYGNINVPGHRGFDKQLIYDFLAALAKTNLAGIESQSSARAMLVRAEAGIAELQRKLSLDGVELISLKHRRQRLASQAPLPPPVARQLQLIDDRLASLADTTSASEEEKRKYQKVVEFARLIARHGEEATSRSFDICSRLSRLAAGGLDVANSSRRSYVLSGKWLFVPHVTPVSEEEILAVASGELPASSCEWLSPQFAVFQEVRDQALLLPRALPGGLESGRAEPAAAPPLVIVMDSTALRAGQTPSLKIMGRSPFGGVAIALGQLFFYGENALQSGADIRASWSVVLRDLVALRRDRTNGEAQPSTEAGWCGQNYLPETGCPALAGEFQIGSPLPDIPDLPADLHLTNPANLERATLIPPVPAGMI